MSQTELKFALSDEAAERWLSRLRDMGARPVKLESRYFDSPDARLHRNKVSLRIRREGQKWLQTLKAPGSSPVDRLEHEAPIASRRAGAQKLDLAQHRESEAFGLLISALNGSDASVLSERHRVEVTRWRLPMTADGAEVEVALDVGRIRAGDRQAPLAELEFELKNGSSEGLFGMAKVAVVEGGLWLSTISKDERGERLVQQTETSPSKAKPLDVFADADGQTLMRSVLRNALEHVLANASEVAEGSESPEVIHQTRVGLRRLRTALRELAPLSPAIRPEWEPALRKPFAHLGERRDNDAVAAAVKPRLAAAGAPKLSWTPPPYGPSTGIVREPAFQATLLEILALSHASADRFVSIGNGKLTRLIAKRLTKLDRAVRRDGRAFQQLPTERQHQVRKRLKRLRYLAEFVSPLWPGKAVSHYIDQLKPAQEALGSHNDGLVAAERFRHEAQADASAWFAVGWLESQSTVTSREASKALRRLDKGRRFWLHK